LRQCSCWVTSDKDHIEHNESALTLIAGIPGDIAFRCKCRGAAEARPIGMSEEATFFQLHQLFDQIHGEIEESVDTIAERIMALQGVADGRLQTVMQITALEEYPANARSGEDHLRAVGLALARFAKAVRADIDASASKGDALTADVFTEISRATDQLLCLVEARFCKLQ
jgi:DNA-binding ferritin-like protein